MIHASPSKKLVEEKNRLILKTGLYRNISFVVLLVVLLISFILNFDPTKDLSGKQLPGTLLVILLIISTSILSLLKWELIIDKEHHNLVIRYRILSHQFTRENITLDKLRGIKIHRISPGGIPKYSIYQLTLMVTCPKAENGEREIMIYSNTTKSETEIIGKKIANFINTRYLDDISNPEKV